MSTSVRPISPEQFLDHVDERGSASFLQTPAWARVKSDWRSETLGFFADGVLAGVGLVLYRKAPRIPRYFAYLPEGPVLDWTSPHVDAWLRDLRDHVKRRGAFGVRIGPAVVEHVWHTATIKDAIADDGVRSLTELTPDESPELGASVRRALVRGGWLPPADGEGFAAGQPRHNFQLPLAGKSEDDVLKGMNQLWRRNIKKADKSGVEVTRGTRADLGAFHAAYVETAERDGFTPRPLAYFETMWDALTSEANPGPEPDRLRLYLAHHEGDLVAATTWVRVGTHAWYSYGASTNAKREVRGSNAIQWRMIRDALAAGADVYDLRGITDSVASDDPHLGLIQFKVGTGGQAVAYVGEWDLPINPLLHRAFTWYMERRAS